MPELRRLVLHASVQIDHVVIHDQELRVAVVDDEGEAFAAEPGIDGVYVHPDLLDPEEDIEELRRVAHERCKPVARLCADPEEIVRKPVRVLVHLPVRYGAVLVHEV